MRFRVIGERVSSEEVKCLLNCQPKGEEEEEQMEREYVSMGEIKRVLMDRPFYLNEHEANQVSRYVVEDSPNEYVY